MKKQTLAIFFIVVLLALAMSLFAACDGGEQTEEGVFYIPPKAPSGDLPEVTKPETDYNLPQQITKEDCEGMRTFDEQRLCFIIKNGKAVIDYNDYSTYYFIEDLKSEITIPSKVHFISYDFDVEIADRAFTSVKQLKKVVISEGVEKIGAYAFYGLNELEEVVLPNTLSSIESYAFLNCDSLLKIAIPASVSYMGRLVFDNYETGMIIQTETRYKPGGWDSYWCTHEARVVWDYITNPRFGSLRVIRQGNFYYTLSGHEATLVLFDRTSKQTAIEIPGKINVNGYDFTVGIIKDKLFKGYQALTSVTFNEGLYWLQPECFKGTSIREVKLPQSMRSISNKVFADTKIQQVTIPAGVEIVYQDAFKADTLTSVVFEVTDGWITTREEQIVDVTNPEENAKLFKGENNIIALERIAQ